MADFFKKNQLKIYVLKKKIVKANLRNNRNNVSDLQFIVQFVCDGKNRVKTKMKKLKF
jgi:hypothetical protein